MSAVTLYLANAIEMVVQKIEAEFVNGVYNIPNGPVSPDNTVKNSLWSYHTTYDKARKHLVGYCQSQIDNLKRAQKVWEEKIERLNK